MQNLRIDDSSSAAAAAAVNNRRSNSLHSQQHHNYGGVSSDTRSNSSGGGGGVAQLSDYNKYNVAPLKYDQHSTSGWTLAAGGGGGTDSRNNEQYIHQSHQQYNHAQQQKLQQQYQGVPSSSSSVTYAVNNSPTHSLSGSSHHSESPRTSMVLPSGQSIGSGGGGVRIDSRMAHMYENIDYYAPPITQQHQPVAGNAAEQSVVNNGAGYFESRNKKAQPQVPSNGGGISLAGRFAHTPQPEYECAPIYENIPANATGVCVFFFY